MNFIPVDLSCPATSRNYDYKLPIKMKAGKIKKQIIEDIRTLEGIAAIFEKKKDVHFYSSEGCIDDEMTLELAGVKNGDKIMLI